MFDFIKLFFASLRAAFNSLNQPSPNVGIRRMQLCIVIMFLTGSLLFVGSIYLLLQFNGAGMRWFWLLVSGGVLWTIAACLGEVVEKLVDEMQP